MYELYSQEYPKKGFFRTKESIPLFHINRTLKIIQIEHSSFMYKSYS